MKTYKLIYENQEVEVQGHNLTVRAAVEAAMEKWKGAPWVVELVATGQVSSKHYDWEDNAPTEALVVTKK